MAVAATAIALSSLALLHVVRADIDPSRRMISEYAIGAHGWLMTSCFVAGAALAIAIALAGSRMIESRSTLFWLSLVVMAVTMALTMGQHRPDAGLVGWTNRAFMIGYALWLAAAAWPMARGARSRAV